MNAPSNLTDDSPPSRRKAKGSRPFILVILFSVLLLSALTLGERLLRQFFAPWSLPQDGRPALFGSWAGPVALENGVTGTMQLTLVDTLDQQESWFDLLIEGSALYCLGDVSGDFEVYGHIDRHGNVADLRFRPAVDNPIWLLHSMSSQWLGDTLELSGTSSYDPSAAHTARADAPEPPITITLQRAEGVANCPENGL